MLYGIRAISKKEIALGVVSPADAAKRCFKNNIKDFPLIPLRSKTFSQIFSKQNMNWQKFLTCEDMGTHFGCKWCFKKLGSSKSNAMKHVAICPCFHRHYDQLLAENEQLRDVNTYLATAKDHLNNANADLCQNSQHSTSNRPVDFSSLSNESSTYQTIEELRLGVEALRNQVETRNIRGETIRESIGSIMAQLMKLSEVLQNFPTQTPSDQFSQINYVQMDSNLETGHSSSVLTQKQQNKEFSTSITLSESVTILQSKDGHEIESNDEKNIDTKLSQSPPTSEPELAATHVTKQPNEENLELTLNAKRTEGWHWRQKLIIEVSDPNTKETYHKCCFCSRKWSGEQMMDPQHKSNARKHIASCMMFHDYYDRLYIENQQLRNNVNTFLDDVNTFLNGMNNHLQQYDSLMWTVSTESEYVAALRVLLQEQRSDEYTDAKKTVELFIDNTICDLSPSNCDDIRSCYLNSNEMVAFSNPLGLHLSNSSRPELDQLCLYGTRNEIAQKLFETKNVSLVGHFMMGLLCDYLCMAVSVFGAGPVSLDTRNEFLSAIQFYETMKLFTPSRIKEVCEKIGLDSIVQTKLVEMVCSVCNWLLIIPSTPNYPQVSKEVHTGFFSNFIHLLMGNIRDRSQMKAEVRQLDRSPISEQYDLLHNLLDYVQSNSTHISQCSNLRFERIRYRSDRSECSSFTGEKIPAKVRQ